VGIPTFIVSTIEFSNLQNNPEDSIVLTATIFVSIVTFYIFEGAAVHGSIVSFNGRKASIGECLLTARKHLLFLLSIGILMWLGISVGLLFFIVPGVIYGVRWIVAIPVQIVENVGIFESFRRSRELTEGNRWKIFSLVFIYMIILAFLIVTSLAIDYWVGNFDAVSRSDAGIIGAANQAITNVIGAIINIAGVSTIYYELRKAKEDLDTAAAPA
jgi:hypothetical protein